MGYFRINIYLTLKCFLKSLLNTKIDKKKIEYLISKNSQKKYFVTTSQLRVGFLILLKYLKKKYPDKKEIIFQPFNLPEMINVALNTGMKINFCKLNINSGEPDLKFLSKIITKNTVAFVATNIFSSPHTLQQLKRLCLKKKIFLIEDNAIYFDNYYLKKKKKLFSGSLGDYSLYSFNIMKNISAFFGGGVSTNDKKFIEFANKEIKFFKEFSKIILLKQVIIFFVLKALKLRILYKFFILIIKRAHKKKLSSILKIAYPSLKFKKVKFPEYYFTKISELSKKAILLQLEDKFSRNLNHKIRKKNNIFYYNLFKKMKIKNIQLLKIKDFNFQNFMDFPILVKNKEKLNDFLLSRGVELKYIVYHDCVNIFYKKYQTGIKKNSKYFSDHVIGLPNHYKVSEKYMHYIGNKIKEFYERNK